MISIRKFINPALKTSNDVMNDIFVPINKRIGFVKGASPIIPIYFYRCIGIKENEEEYYGDLEKLDERLSKLKNLYLKFVDNIPFKNNNELISKVQNMWGNNKFETINGFNIEDLMKQLKIFRVMPDLNTTLLNESVEESFHYVMDIYFKKEHNANSTKVKNFILKFLSWINEFVPTIIKNFNISSNSGEIVNPKIVYTGNIKKHEVLFLIFLSRLGCDILYINSPVDCDFSLVDEQEKYSKIMKLPKKNTLDTNRINKILQSNKKVNSVSETNTHSQHNNFSLNRNVIKNSTTTNSTISSSMLNNNTNNFAKHKDIKFDLTDYGECISSVLKNSNDIINEFSNSLTNRSGFIGKPSPIVPIYFYRYIGISENKDEYYNNLYRLDKKLDGLGDLYLKFTFGIPMVSNTELISKTNNVWSTLENFDKNKKDVLMGLLVKSGAFPDLREKVIISSIVKSFNDILELYISNETNINMARVKNFCLKILMWMHKYLPDLFKKFDYLKNSTGEIYNPKVVYYGYIKKHEAYFLALLAKMGCDVLYINSDKDEVFQEIDREEIYTKTLILSETEPVKEFPKEEIIVRQETTAFKASREIANVIYNEDDGLYRPWQFEEYNIYPKTLKTTYDELKILWKEEARMRPGFKVENGTVYIPNLFAKISGVNNELNDYWKDFCHFKEVDNVFYIPDIPYIKNNYSRHDLYSLEYCFDKDKLVDKEKLIKHRLYKFAYLKTALQDIIIDKINQIIKLSILKKAIDTEYRLKILMTILNMDANILELIQKFDYPFKVPKLLIYDNDKDIFSDEDSIMLAFLNLMGIDIVVFTPTGYNNLEGKIDDKFYDTHKFENINFDLQVPNSFKFIRKNKQGSFWSNLFR